MKKINRDKLAQLVTAHTLEEISDNKVGCKEVIVHQNGECVFSGVFGVRSVGGEPAKPGMLYRAASMTKPITAVAVLQLIDKGLLSLDDKTSKFFPQAKELCVAKTENNRIVSLVPLKKEIVVRNLLSHTSGIGCAPVDSILPSNNNTVPLSDAMDAILSHPLSFEPDTSESYSATEAFDIAAGIVQLITGCPFDEYLKKNIFEPLTMVNTTFSPTDAQWAETVTMHSRTSDGRSKNAAMPDGCVFSNYITARMPAGAGLMTSADDYAKFAEMLLEGGVTHDGTRLVSENAIKLMSSPQIPDSIDMGNEKWGLGVRIVTSKDYPHGLGIGCFGWSGAYGTHFWIDPKNRITAVMMKNSLYDGGGGNRSACSLERDVCASLE